MILYHATTAIRGEKILSDGCIKKNIKQYYTKENNSSGYTTQGYIYLSNELTFAMHFANCHNIADKTEEVYIFRVEIPDNLIEPDYDELRYQRASEQEIANYGGDLNCSLFEYKSCRIPVDIDFNKYNCYYFIKKLSNIPPIDDLINNCGHNYNYVINNYTIIQREFIDSIEWLKL